MSKMELTRNDSQADHVQWNRLAEHFHALGSPLRPSPEDIGVMERKAIQVIQASGSREARALLWGVTPEIASMAWPPGTFLTAVDQTEAMVRLVWPGDIPGRRKVTRGTWYDLPVPDSSCDVVLGDGAFSCVPYPDGYHALATSARRVLKPGGALIVRFFVRPEEREAPEQVCDDLLSGKIHSFHAFKVRLAVATPEGNEASFCKDDVWKIWVRSGIDKNALASATGWPLEAIETVEAYKDSAARLSFPTLKEVLEAISGDFELVSAYTPGYELGERCPILELAPRRRASDS